MILGFGVTVLMKQMVVGSPGRPGMAATNSSTHVVKFASFHLWAEGFGQTVWTALVKACKGMPYSETALLARRGIARW